MPWVIPSVWLFSYRAGEIPCLALPFALLLFAPSPILSPSPSLFEERRRQSSRHSFPAQDFLSPPHSALPLPSGSEKFFYLRHSSVLPHPPLFIILTWEQEHTWSLRQGGGGGHCMEEYPRHGLGRWVRRRTCCCTFALFLFLGRQTVQGGMPAHPSGGGAMIFLALYSPGEEKNSSPPPSTPPSPKNKCSFSFIKQEEASPSYYRHACLPPYIYIFRPDVRT